MIIQRLNENHLTRVCQLIQQDSYQSFLQHTIYSLKSITNFLRTRLTDSEQFFYGAIENGRLIGFCHIVLQEHNVFLNHIAVDETEMNKGIGKKLLNFFISFEFKGQECKQRALKVDSRNVKAMQWYLKNNFKLVGSSPVTRLEFRKKLLVENDFYSELEDPNQYREFGFSYINFECANFGVIGTNLINVPENKLFLLERFMNKYTFSSFVISLDLQTILNHFPMLEFTNSECWEIYTLVYKNA